MTYKDIFMYTSKYWNFNVGFQLVKEIVGVVKDDIKGFNFNRYGMFGEGSPPPCADPRQHITIRLDFKNLKAIQAVEDKLNQMISDGRIDDWCREKDYPYDDYGVTPFRLLDPVYHTAHDTATACAFKFYEIISNNSSEFQEFRNYKFRYLKGFLPVWLRESGFQALNSANAAVSPFKAQLTANCAEVFKEIIDKKKLTDMKKFVNRLLHLFLNCICISRSEEERILVYLGSLLGFRGSFTYDELCERLGQTLMDCARKLSGCSSNRS